MESCILQSATKSRSTINNNSSTFSLLDADMCDDLWINVIFYLNVNDFISINITCHFFNHLTSINSTNGNNNLNNKSNSNCNSKQSNNKYYNRLKKHCAFIARDLTIKIPQLSETIESELKDIKPQVEKAQRNVSLIKRRQLDTIVTFRPSSRPILVESTLYAVMIVLGKKCRDWTSLRREMGHNYRFMVEILNFDTKEFSLKRRKKIEKKYLSNQDMTVENVSKSNKACGVFWQWVLMQLKFAKVLDTIEPITNDLKNCKQQLAKLKTSCFD